MDTKLQFTQHDNGDVTISMGIQPYEIQPRGPKTIVASVRLDSEAWKQVTKQCSGNPRKSEAPPAGEG